MIQMVHLSVPRLYTMSLYSMNLYSARPAEAHRHTFSAGDVGTSESPMRTRYAALALAAVVSLAGMTGAVATAAETDDIPPAPQLLPEDTLAFVRIDDVDQMREDFADSSMGKMLSDPKMTIISRHRANKFTLVAIYPWSIPIRDAKQTCP